MSARTRVLPVLAAFVAILTTACDTATSPTALSGPRASASGGTSIAQPDIQLSGSASTTAPAAGATYSYTFQAKNSGTAIAPGVQFITVLPAELPPALFHSVTNSDGSACTANFVDAQVYIACNLGDMAVGVQKTITIVVTAPAAGLTYSDWATAYESDVLTNLLADKNLGDNAKGITVTVGGAINVAVPATGFGGNWSGTIGNPDVGLGLFTMKLSVVGTTVTGQLRAGAPIFDSGFNMSSGSLTSPTTMVGLIARSQGFIEVTGTLSADGTTITGIFGSNGTPSYPFTVTRQ
jgi:uncharacterized repeat protein (TIGR01451 family)